MAMAMETAQTTTEIQTIVEVGDDLTSQSRHSLLLQGSPPSGKLLIPLERRDVRVVEGARLESAALEQCGDVPNHIFRSRFNDLIPASLSPCVPVSDGVCRG